MGKVNCSCFGTVSNWPAPGELGSLCDNISKTISCKTIMLNKRTNSIATPSSMLNMMNLQLKNGDKIELILLADSEHELSMNTRKAKELLGKYIKFD